MTTEAAAEYYKAKHVWENEGRGWVVFNPNNKPLNELPVIMAFSNVKDGGDGIAYAIAQDGECLGSHWCSHEAYVPSDLGVLEGRRLDRHETYQKHYPDGYRMEFIPASEVMSHPLLEEAFRLNQEKAKENQNEKTNQTKEEKHAGCDSDQRSRCE